MPRSMPMAGPLTPSLTMICAASVCGLDPSIHVLGCSLALPRASVEGKRESDRVLEQSTIPRKQVVHLIDQPHASFVLNNDTDACATLPRCWAVRPPGFRQCGLGNPALLLPNRSPNSWGCRRRGGELSPRPALTAASAAPAWLAATGTPPTAVGVAAGAGRSALYEAPGAGAISTARDGPSRSQADGLIASAPLCGRSLAYPRPPPDPPLA